jgi:hypothetical protein
MEPVILDELETLLASDEGNSRNLAELVEALRDAHELSRLARALVAD